MSRSSTRRWLPAVPSVSLVTLAVAAMLLSAGSVPHAHIGPDQGLYNHDHDLSYLATFGSVAPVSASVAIFVGLVILPGVVAAVTGVASPPHRRADSRAPPVR